MPMKRGHIEQRGENKFLVSWRAKDPLTGKTTQPSKIVEGDYGRALAFLADKLKPQSDAHQQTKPVERTLG